MAKGWLDNYNDSKASAPEGFQGDGYSTVGRNYSPAWGGQFQMGGSLPGAVGFTYARTQSPAPSNGKYAKKTMASAQEGVQVTPKLIKISASENPDPTHVHQIRRTKSLEGLGKRSLPVEQAATNEFVDWYTNPETIKRFESNTGIPGNRLQDFVGKALRTPIRPAKEDDALSVDDNAQYRDAFWQDQNYRDLNKSTGEILYHGNLGAPTKSVLAHELAHASNIDELLGPKVKSILGMAKNIFADEKAYLNRPTETYGNFHEFRKNLGLKPGQKIDKPTLQKLVKKKNLGNERFYRAYDPDKITKAINTIALNDDSQNDYMAKDGKVIKDDMGQWAHPGEITEINSPYITMRDVPYPVLGVSDEGDAQVMYPDEDYEFIGNKVTEYPMARNGIRQEQKGLENLDQLTNFTNYNTKQSGGWLDNL